MTPCWHPAQLGSALGTAPELLLPPSLRSPLSAILLPAISPKTCSSRWEGVTPVEIPLFPHTFEAQQPGVQGDEVWEKRCRG